MKKFNNFKDLKFLKDNSKSEVKVKKTKDLINPKKPTLFKNNYFNELVIEDESSGFKSFFTDDQVINLIQKISNRNIRKLVWEFQWIRYKKTSRSLILKFILHTICNKLLDLYGPKMISYIIDLKVLPRTNNISKIHSDIYSINIDKEDLSFENFQIRQSNKMQTALGNLDYHSLKYIGFEISDYNKKPYMIICDNYRYLEGRINEFGYIEDDFIRRMKFNIFQFMEEGELSYYDGAILNCYCSNPSCGKELTVPESVFYGMGPVCRENYYNKKL